MKTGSRLALEDVNAAAVAEREGIVQVAITFLAVVGGLAFSVAVALVAEEFIFGQVIRVFFVRHTVAAKAGQQRLGAKGERQC